MGDNEDQRDPRDRSDGWHNADTPQDPFGATPAVPSPAGDSQSSPFESDDLSSLFGPSDDASLFDVDDDFDDWDSEAPSPPPPMSERTWRHPSEAGRFAEQAAASAGSGPAEGPFALAAAAVGTAAVVESRQRPGDRLSYVMLAGGVLLIAAGITMSAVGLIRQSLPPSGQQIASGRMSHTIERSPEQVVVTDNGQSIGGLVTGLDGTIAAVFTEAPPASVTVSSQLWVDDARLLGWDPHTGIAVFRTQTRSNFRAVQANSTFTPRTRSEVHLAVVPCPKYTPGIPSTPVVSPEGEVIGLVSSRHDNVLLVADYQMLIDVSERYAEAEDAALTGG